MAIRQRTTWCLVLITGFAAVCAATCIFLYTIKPRGPSIDIDNQAIDLGIIDSLEPNVPKRVSFSIRNRGMNILKLTRVQAGCPCIEPRLDKSILSPGEVAHLSVRVTVPNRIGEFQERILLFSNDHNEPVKKLFVKGFVHRDCYVLPESVTVNALRIGDNRQIELEVNGPVNNRAFTIREVSAVKNQVQSHKIEKIGTMAESGRTVWRITLAVTSRGMQVWEDTIRILTSSRESPLLEVPVKVRESPPVRVSPAVAILKYSPDNKPSTTLVEITGNTSKSLTIVDIEKPEWLDLQAGSNLNKLPTKLFLTLKEAPDRITFSGKEYIMLKFGEDFPQIKIPIFVLSAITPKGHSEQKDG